MFNYLSPSRVSLSSSRVVEIAPNVSGRVTAIPVRPKVPVNAGTTLFRIDPTPFQYKVDQLEACWRGQGSKFRKSKRVTNRRAPTWRG